jgi:hypothetical protein
LANESGSTAIITADFMGLNGGAVRRSYEVPSGTRHTVHVNAVPGVTNGAWIAMRSTVPIVAERATYLLRNGAWVGGDVTAGALAASPTWYFADGSAGGPVDTRLHLANPQPVEVVADLLWMRWGLGPLHEVRVLPPLSNTIVEAGAVPGMTPGGVSIAVSATGSIVAERAMSWPFGPGTWYETHTRTGAPRAGTRWVFAEGEVGGVQNVDTYLVFANPGDEPVLFTMNVIREAGAPIPYTLRLNPQARTTIRLRDVGLADGERFGVEVESSLPIVVERSVYWTADWQYMRGGTNEAGYRVR